MSYLDNTLQTNTIQLKKDLADCDKKNTQFFTFDGNEYLAKCISVYDGDTITVAFKPFNCTKCDGRVYKYNIRLSGIDTPEIRTSNQDEKKKALEIRDLLREKILNKFIIINCGKFDKYGRLLGYVYNEDKSVCYNNWLIDQGFAYVYDGGTKKTFSG